MKHLVFGSTGVVGQALVAQLIEDKAEVICVVRKSGSVPVGAVEVVVPEQTKLDEILDNFNDAHVYVCIGTTAAKTPDKEQYYQIDHDIPVAVAIAAAANNTLSLHVISAMGANVKSSIFYNRTKGEMERDVLDAKPDSYIYRPSMIMGEREEKRTMEAISKAIFAVINPLIPTKYKGIYPAQIAANMRRNALEGSSDKLWENDMMLKALRS